MPHLVRQALGILATLFMVVPGPGLRAAGETQGDSADRAGENVWMPQSLIWTSPSKGPTGSMPIGNGDIGANLWVEPNGDLVFYLSKTDAWSENGRLLKLGRVRVKTEPPLLANGAEFTQTLDPASGVIRIESKTGERKIAMRFWIDANHPVVHVDLVSGKPVKLSAAAEVWRTKRRQLKGQEMHSAYGINGKDAPPIFVEPDTIVPGLRELVTIYHRNERSIWKSNLELQALGDLTETMTDPLLHRTFGFAMRGDGMANSSPTRLDAREARRNWSLEIHPLTMQTGTSDEWLAALDRQIRQLAAADKAARFAAHREWRANFWQRSWIVVSGGDKAAEITQAYALQRWIHACGGRGAQPIKFNGSIFTVDGNEKGRWDADYRRWGGPFWWQNTRLPYWSMLSSGDFDLMQPLFAMYLDTLPLRKAAVRKYYGHDGAFYPETMYFWGSFVDENYGRDRKGKPDGLTDNGYIRRYWQSAIELVMMMLDYHDRTDDATFRDQTLLPLATEITTFFNQHWPRNAQGKIHFHPSQSLETYWDATNPMPEIVGLRAVLPRLLALPAGEAQKETWRDMLADLPPVPTAQRNGKTILVPAEKWANKRNTENPEFYAVFPYRAYTLMQGTERLQTARNTWPLRKHKGTGGWQQNAIKAALLGFDREAAGFVSANAGKTASGFRFPAIWAAELRLDPRPVSRQRDDDRPAAHADAVRGRRDPPDARLAEGLGRRFQVARARQDERQRNTHRRQTDLFGGHACRTTERHRVARLGRRIAQGIGRKQIALVLRRTLSVTITI